ncbi:ROK family transcriptional regulator [uncultured Massilia sp.]|uniref:ROK family transcriptional regulator n=1 Tax=uncultured Massilia sp. TaxID=169973 RepID=UPI0025F5E559|nr:ROK family transcriptional regulator [uncultured Massilia sp.]
MSDHPAASDHTLQRLPGANQVGMREYNERLLLQAIRLHGSLPKAELARLTKLSGQTVSVIVERLLDEGLVERQAAQRGRVGQPSRPIALRPDAAFAVGVRLGRRSLDVLLLDFAGQPRWRSATPYPAPRVDEVFAAIGAELARIHDVLGEGAGRIAGIGLAAPLAFGGWHDLLGMEAREAAAWAGLDLRARLQAATPLPVEFAKDTAAACVAELVAGRGRGLENYLYVFVDVLAGGGLVIDGQPHGGRHGNAGAIGSMPLGLAGAGRAGQVLDEASLVGLERMFGAAGLEPLAFTDARVLAAPWEPVTRAWIARAADAIAFAICGAACVLDLDGAIVDGAVDRALLAALLTAVEAALGRYDWQGAARPPVLAGAVGADAKAYGAACLPLHSGFAPAHDLFLKDARRQGRPG